jgi:hypothetical protein
MSDTKRRKPNPPWKKIMGRDRGYDRRIENAVVRGQYTAPGTNPNAADSKKIAAKRRARASHE